ncbi:MAG TPA: carboxymuconolactone decarboxylase family protein [Pseudonocardia sp.]|nr:carboxymuconolactone decarboxylase family protein [Pseudonocardia sp.]
MTRSGASPEVAAIYDAVFGGDRDPVSQPGTSTGTPGDWWTTMAVVPDYLKSFMQQFELFTRPERELDPLLRELALVRTGFVAGSRFVFSQHSKVARACGNSAEKVAAIPSWPTSPLFNDAERAVLAYIDELVLQRGRVQDATFSALSTVLSDVAVLELTVLVTTYQLHATISRALRLEYDNVEEGVSEVPAPPGFRDEELLALMQGHE